MAKGIKIPKSDATLSKRYKVSGQVFNSLGEPVAKQQVWAADVDLRGAAIYKTAATIIDINNNGGFDFLGKTVTNTDGYYEIYFTKEMYSRNELGLADVIVFAIDEEVITARSKLAAENDYTNNELPNWNITLPNADKRGISEYTRLMQVIEPFVEQSKLQLFELNSSPDQVNFLATETKQDQSHTALVVQADVLKNECFVQTINKTPDSVLQTYRELFYGIGRQAITLSWVSILQNTTDELEDAINQSVNQNIIDQRGAQFISDFIANITDVSAQRSTTAPETSNFYKTIGIAIKDTELQKTFAKMYLQFSGNPPDFWESLSKEAGFTPEIVQSLQLTNQLSILTGQNTDLIQELQVSKAITDPSDLLSITAAEWGVMIQKTGVPDSIPGNSDEEIAANYVNGMQNLLNGAYPTQKIALMVNDKDTPFPIKDANLKEGVAAFLSKAQNFDISTMRITDFDNTINEVVNNDKDKHDQLLNQLQIIQRIYQVSPTPNIMYALLKKGYTSAYNISSITQNTFINTEGHYLGSSDIAFSVYNRARFQVMRGQQILLKIQDTQDKTIPSKIITPQQQQGISTFLNNLNNSKS
jgi:hypothetical protein